MADPVTLLTTGVLYLEWIAAGCPPIGPMFHPELGDDFTEVIFHLKEASYKLASYEIELALDNCVVSNCDESFKNEKYHYFGHRYMQQHIFC